MGCLPNGVTACVDGGSAGCGNYTSFYQPEDIRPEAIMAARKRGVIFDTCNGRSNFSLKAASRSIKEGFLPDIISSDLNGSWLHLRDTLEGNQMILPQMTIKGGMIVYCQADFA